VLNVFPFSFQTFGTTRVDWSILCADNISLRDAIGQWTAGSGKRKPVESIERPDAVSVEAAAAAARPPAGPVYEATDEYAIYEETDIVYEHLGRREANPGSNRTYQSLVKDQPKCAAAAAGQDYRAHRKHK